MMDLFSPRQRRDLIDRGFSRRDFARLAAFLAAGSSLSPSFYPFLIMPFYSGVGVGVEPTCQIIIFV